MEDVSVYKSFTKNEPLWRDRNQGLSLEISKDCHAILRKFFHIDLVKTVILHETAESEQLHVSCMSVNMEPEQQLFARPEFFARTAARRSTLRIYSH